MLEFLIVFRNKKRESKIIKGDNIKKALKKARIPLTTVREHHQLPEGSESKRGLMNAVFSKRSRHSDPD